MNWTRIAQVLSDSLCLLLILRLYALHLYSVYRVFAIFLICQLLSDIAAMTSLFFRNEGLDYRIIWLVLFSILGFVSLWMTYSLMQAILANYSGILRVTRGVLNISVPLAVGISLLTAAREFSASGANGIHDRLDQAVATALIVDRVISTVALLTLLLMLAFVLWFPVRMPRNLAAFSIGFVFYFTVETVLLLVHFYWSHSNFALLDTGVNLVLSMCYLYWLLLLNQQGEAVPVIIGHRWRPGDQGYLTNELEIINAQLLKTARR